MPPKEPSRYQLSSRLTFNQDTPAFLQRLKNKVAGVSNDEDEDFDEWQAASGRPPIPRRPTPPERPADEPGSADEEDDDEKPQVVVLREGKHLTAREAENERRKAQGLAPLPDGSTDRKDEDELEKTSGTSADKQKQCGKESNAKSSLSFSSTGASNAKSYAKKRKVIGDGPDDVLEKQKTHKKVKQGSKAKKTKSGALLSFGDDDG
ncbi:uncharacterized protein FOMMEDRAFT_165381 [Fomitiporia mediterranea MF3/22]|uniref:uncharacterized protein n=1 Tax=Fomitiporia mediterranea (strain MF3/22) TaxID=694068 RepID=UPI000440830E|nr:uncharacterized protein FOMMEDRAFT_165381 [Fomitiporia mediterranea MF3/22]EJD06641.1 hypothetical protein FOMMEDRAFT_165381 [Fomitiporia mediterranea MF3/22]